MRRLGVLGLTAAALFLYACASGPKPAPGPLRPAPAPVAPKPAEPEKPAVPIPREPEPAPSLLEILGPAALPGWAAEDHLAALRAFQAGCGVVRPAPMQAACNKARLMRDVDRDDARRFFEETFAVEPIDGTGVLTAYFAPQYEAREKATKEFNMPVRPVPADLKPGQTYASRTDIEARPAKDALAWMRAEDLFFLQVQGSGTLVFADGERKKAVFAAHNSRPFAGIANPMRDKGLLARDNTSGDAIRQWLADHRGKEADAIMRLNPRYVFFTLAEDDGQEPVGAAGIALPPGHAVAVDPKHHPMGELLWIDGTSPLLQGAFPSYRRLVVALDTGGAIQGEVRADLYLGRGDAAGREAGRVRHDLKMYRLVPRESAP